MPIFGDTFDSGSYETSQPQYLREIGAPLVQPAIGVGANVGTNLLVRHLLTRRRSPSPPPPEPEQKCVIL